MILNMGLLIFGIWGIAWCIQRVSRYPPLEPRRERAKVKRKRTH